MGWMGHVHARAYRTAAERWPELDVVPQMAICADYSEKLAAKGAAEAGFARYSTDWREAVADPAVDVVSICLPNKFHAQACEAAAAAGKHIWCEKPVGRNRSEAAAAAAAASKAGVASMAGFNYRWMPMVQYAQQLLSDGKLGEFEMFRGRFFSMFGHDPMGLHTWRFTRDMGGVGAAGDLLSHVIDMAITMGGPIKRVCGQKHTYITERPVAQPGQSHYGQGSPDDPKAAVENEDLAHALCEFANGRPGMLEGWRSACGPKSEMAFELFGRNGSARWCFERMNELDLYLHAADAPAGYTNLLAGVLQPDHARFNPGEGNGIGYEECKAIEAANFLGLALAGQSEPSGLQRASEVADVADAVLRSAVSGKWENVG